MVVTLTRHGFKLSISLLQIRLEGSQLLSQMRILPSFGFIHPKVGPLRTFQVFVKLEFFVYLDGMAMMISLLNNTRIKKARNVGGSTN